MLLSVDISFRRAILEIAIIVVGVLIALGADNWNSTRIDRGIEAEYLQRLAVDVSYNAELAGSIIGALERKLLQLDYLAEILSEEESVVDATSVVVAIGAGADLGWTFPRFRTTTFEEMQSTGRLGLVRDVAVRAALIEYDTLVSDSVDRIQARRSGFPAYSYSLLSPNETSELNLADLGHMAPEIVEVSSSMAERVMTAIRDPDFEALLNSERNFAVFATGIVDEHRIRAEELLSALEQT